MGGSSDPDTDDNWWFDYLRGVTVVEKMLSSKLFAGVDDEEQ